MRGARAARGKANYRRKVAFSVFPGTHSGMKAGALAPLRGCNKKASVGDARSEKLMFRGFAGAPEGSGAERGQEVEGN